MEPQDSASPGLFFVVPIRKERHVSGRDEALPGERPGDRPGRARGARVGTRDDRPDGRPEVLRPARDVAAHDAADPRVRRVRVRRRPRLRRFVDSRLAGDLGVGHAADAGRRFGDPRSVHRGADAVADLRDRRSDHQAAVREGPTPHRAEGRGVPPLDGDRGHGVHGARVRVLHLRRGLVRARPEPLPLLGRFG